MDIVSWILFSVSFDFLMYFLEFCINLLQAFCETLEFQKYFRITFFPGSIRFLTNEVSVYLLVGKF